MEGCPAASLAVKNQVDIFNESIWMDACGCGKVVRLWSTRLGHWAVGRSIWQIFSLLMRLSKNP